MSRILLALICAMLIGGCKKDDPDPPTPKEKTVVLKTAILKAVSSNDRAQVDSLLRKGADINLNYGDAEDSVTLLMIAVAMGYEDMAKLLIANGAESSSTFEGYNAKDFAIHNLGTDTELINLMRRN